jgi:hypothetical protein
MSTLREAPPPQDPEAQAGQQPDPRRNPRPQRRRGTIERDGMTLTSPLAAGIGDPDDDL